MQFIYNTLAGLVVTLAMPIFAVRAITDNDYKMRLTHNLGILPIGVLAKVSNKNCIWIHAASVGEIVATSPVVKEIKASLPDTPVLVSVVTSSGYHMAQRIIPEAEGIIYCPLDLPFIVDKALDTIKPQVFIMIETELWPNFLKKTEERNIPVMMINGRISDKSFKHYKLFGKYTKKLLNTVEIFCMQSQIDYDHIVALGAKLNNVKIAGNTKYDQTYTEVTQGERQILIKKFGLEVNKPIIIAGSTHDGEEQIILKSFTAFLQKVPNAALIIAPRDISRANEVCNLATKLNLKPSKRSEVEKALYKDNNVLVLDTIGELGRIYSLGDIVFVGGSLVSTGGHNILEPAAHGKAILVGPHMFNFKEIYALLTGREACETVTAENLYHVLCELWFNSAKRQAMGENALQVINENRGAAKRSVEELVKLLAKGQEEVSHGSSGLSN